MKDLHDSVASIEEGSQAYDDLLDHIRALNDADAQVSMGDTLMRRHHDPGTGRPVVAVYRMVGYEHVGESDAT